MPTCTIFDLCDGFLVFSSILVDNVSSILNEHVFVSACNSCFKMLEVSAGVLCSLKRQCITRFVTD
jgi:hypothetical protein